MLDNTGDYLAGGFFGLICVVAVLTPKILSLEDQFTFYASYHNNFVNKFIHFCCIWPIFWTSLVFFSYTTPYHGFTLDLPDWIPLHEYALLNWSAAVAAVYMLYYILLDGRYGGGFVAAGLVFMCWLSANAFSHKLWDNDIKQHLPHQLAELEAWQAALVVHVTAWILQFIGHGKFEGRAPALLDNPSQAFLMAPYFVFLEAVFPLGYHAALKTRVDDSVEKAIADFRNKEGKKSQ